MTQYLVRRMFLMVVTIFIISVITFIVIQLPPGDILTSQIQKLAAEGTTASEEVIESYRIRYGLDKPMYIQYLMWIGNFLRGDMGYSFAQNKGVNQLVWDRIGYTTLIAFMALILTWVISLPIGIYSAVKRYTLPDYIFTFLGFIGIATPAFMLALVVMYVAFDQWGISVGGLFSPEMQIAPWSRAKFVDLLQHLWIPVILLGISGTAASIRVLRANLIDELEKPYVRTARAKGVSPLKLLIKYPVRIALNPFLSTVGWTLPFLFAGTVILSIVLSLPTIGPILFQSLMDQDMFLAASLIFITSSLTVIGTLVSDILLALSDPRIRYE